MEKTRLEKYIKLIIYLSVIVLINIAGITLFFRIDLTKNKIYSLSKASKKVVSTLSEPLTINVFFTKNLPAPYNNIEQYLRDLLEEYAIYANKYFNYRFYDVSPEEESIGQTAKENRKLAQDYGIHPVQIQQIEKDEVKFKKAYLGLVLIHGDIIEKIPTITSTEGLEYRLTTTIQKLNNKISALLNLPDKIRIKLFLSSSLKAIAPLMGIGELSDLPAKLEDIVKKVNAKNYGKLDYIYLDPSQDPQAEESSKKYHIMALTWPALPDKKIPAGEGVIGLVMEYHDKVKEIPLLNVLRIPIIGTRYDLVDLNKMDETINDNIESLLDINEDLGYLADHGTPVLSSAPMTGRGEGSLKSFYSLISQNYSIKNIDLKDEPIPGSLKCLVIAQPTEKFSDYELYQIDQALMRGTNLAIFMDAFKEAKPAGQQPFAFNQGPTYTPLRTGLEKLLAHYGIRIKKSFVMDENCYRQPIPQRRGGGERPIYFAPIIKNKFINHDLEFMKNIKGLIAVKVSPLELIEERISKNKIKARILFTSSIKSWEMTKRINLNPIFIRPPQSDSERQTLPLAYLLEGEFPSYFAGKPVPEKKTDKTEPEKKEEKAKQKSNRSNRDLSKIRGKGVVLAKSKPAKIFLMGSSEMLKDTILDSEGESPNDMFILNVIDVLNNRKDIAALRSKRQYFNPLNDLSAVTKTFVKTFNIAGLPVLVVLFGLFVWTRRRSRKKRIQMMFEA